MAAPGTPRALAVVVGGGIAGLAAARDLAEAGHEVVVLEAADRVGGKLLRHEVAGALVDVGAEAMLNRRAEGVDLARAVGLEVEHPAVVSSRIHSRGAMRPLPRSLMGVPLDLAALEASGVLSPEGLARAAREVDLPASDLGDPGDPGADVTVGDLVDARFGPEVTDRLVEPLLGGVYSGLAREISARAAVPQLVALAARGSVVTHGGAVPTTYAGPVFAGPSGGMGALPDAVVAAGGLRVRTGTTVRGLRRTPEGLELLLGPTTDPELLRADLVVLATPPAPTARLLADVAPAAASELAAVETASVAVVTLAVRAADAPALAAADTSGFLVPPVERRRIKAATYSFSKWAWVREAGRGLVDGDDVLLLRTSLGRHREERTLQADDAELVAASLSDLHALTGLDARPVDTHVQRWGGGLPQYAVGHVARVARVRTAVAQVPGLAVCGAAYDGVGIPAAVGSAHRAVRELLATRVTWADEAPRGMMEP
ncbi:protoporphyrinogen oxidase [Nocardioides sp. P86]|uniref:protoporphyrinogen oxidase n=1 Tax=Nocardioides sp. P86 TaxID=2939569 RepID=UPI00203DEC1B|nr:protoporphyrinogen oxidase [Nocardioides sp. P86]MCM3514631.1 protoporphyrinogen oxidase [Nocardioides sp. P86]